MNAANTALHQSKPPIKKGTILIWEPVDVFRQALTKLLLSKGLQILAVSTAAEVSQALSKYAANVSILLLGIQVEGAVNIVKKLKTSVKLKSIPVLIFSTRSEREIVISCLQAGAKDFIVKPGVINTSVLDVIFQKIEKIINPNQLSINRLKVGVQSQDAEFLADAKTPGEKVEALIENVSSLLALPYAVSKIIELYSSSESSAGDFEKPLKSDPAITAAVLRRANSITMAAKSEVTSLKQAVARIGLNETRNIASAFSVFKLFPKTEKTPGFNRIEFWSHSLTVGICTNILALIFQYEKSDDCFFAGLLHDIGKMIFDDYLNEEFQEAIEKSFLNRTPLHIEEKIILGIDHSDLGGRIAEKWKFPAHICKAISGHHHLKTGEQGRIEISFDTLVYAGNQMEKALQIGNGGHSIIEEEGLAFWKVLAKKNVGWKNTVINICSLVRDYANTLKIPNHYFELSIPDSQTGTAAVFVPESHGYGPLIQIMLVKMGYNSIVFSSEKELLSAAKSYSLIIADLSNMQTQQIKEFLKKAPAECIILSSDGSFKESVKLPLDFSELRARVDKLTESIALSSTIDIWDYKLVQKKTGSNEKLFQKRVVSFQEAIPAKFQKLKKTVIDGNFVSTARIAGIFVIEAKDFGAGRTAVAASGLEQAAKENNRELCIKNFNILQKNLAALLRLSKEMVK